MHDDLLLRVVDETLAHARSHPEDYQLTPDQIQLLAQEFLVGESHDACGPSYCVADSAQYYPGDD